MSRTPPEKFDADIEHQSALGHKPTVGRGAEVYASARLNKKLLLLNIWSCFGAFTYGFSAAIIASSLGQPNLFAYFPQLVTASNATQLIGLVACLFNVGGATGVFFVSLVSNRFGRKAAFLGSAILCFLGAGLGAGARNYAMLCVGRYFTGAGAWGMMLASITYQQEISPTSIRGAMGGSVGIALMVGYSVAGWVGVGFYYYNDIVNWRIPLALQVFSPLVIAIGLPFVPESPRYLTMKGRSEESLTILKDLHYSIHDPDFLVAREEHYQFEKQAILDKALGGSWLQMFTKYRKRTLCGMLVVVANQFTGANLLANFGVRLYAGLGFNAADSLIMQAGWYTLGTVLAATAVYVVDRLGRVKLLVYCCVGSAVMVSIETALAAQVEGGNTDKKLQSAAVAMQFIWYLAYAYGEPVQFLYIGEIFPNHVREKGVAFALCALNLMAVWVTMAQPTASANIGWKFWLIFIIASFLLGILQWFVLPETKNVPLEEVAALFGDKDEVAIFANDIFIDANGAVAIRGESALHQKL